MEWYAGASMLSWQHQHTIGAITRMLLCSALAVADAVFNHCACQAITCTRTYLASTLTCQ